MITQPVHSWCVFRQHIHNLGLYGYILGVGKIHVPQVTLDAGTHLVLTRCLSCCTLLRYSSCAFQLSSSNSSSCKNTAASISQSLLPSHTDSHHSRHPLHCSVTPSLPRSLTAAMGQFCGHSLSAPLSRSQTQSLTRHRVNLWGQLVEWTSLSLTHCHDHSHSCSHSLTQTQHSQPRHTTAISCNVMLNHLQVYDKPFIFLI